MRGWPWKLLWYVFFVLHPFSDSALSLQQDYVQKAIDGRLSDTPIYGIYEEEEPAVFTCHFRAYATTSSL